MDTIVVFVATGAYSGYSPVAPGTAGTFVGVLCYFFQLRFSNIDYLFQCLLITIIGIGVAHRAEKIFGEKDSGKIVIDEIAGYFFTMFGIPVLYTTSHEFFTDFLPKAVLGFFLFRLTDIVKFPPAKWIDRKMSGGAGVVLDDVVAGIYANLLLRGLIFLWTKIV